MPIFLTISARDAIIFRPILNEYFQSSCNNNKNNETKEK